MKLREITARLPQTVVHGLLLLSGTTVSQLIPALFSPVLTRIYSPSDFGIFALTYAILGVISPVTCMRYDIAIPIPASDDEAGRLVINCILITTALTVLSLVLCIAFWLLAPSRTAASIAAPLIVMLPVGVAILGLQKITQGWAVRLKDFHIQSASLLTQAIVAIGVQIGLGIVWHSNPYFLIIGAQLGLIVANVMFLIALWRRLAPVLARNFSAPHLLATLKDYKRFPIYTGPYAFAGQAASRATLMILASLAKTGVVGQYALAQRVVFLPISTIMGTASQIFFSRVARKLSDPRLPGAMRWALVSGAMMLGPLFTLGFLYSRVAFGYVFGANWTEAGIFGTILFVPSMIITMTAWMDRIYDIRAKQRLALFMEIANDVAALGSMGALLYFTRDPEKAVVAFAASTVAFYLIWTYVTLRLAHVSAAVYWEFVGTLAGTLAAMLAVHFAVHLLTENGWIHFGALAFTCALFVSLGARTAWRGLHATVPPPSAVALSNP